MSQRTLTLGIDVGSSHIKMALVDYSGDPPVVLDTIIEKLRKRNPTAVIEGAVGRLLEKYGLAYEDLSYVASTGEGELVGRLGGRVLPGPQAGGSGGDIASASEQAVPPVRMGRRGHFYSMTTHARGAYHFHPEARTVVDLGALFCRVISIDTGGRVRSYAMTGQCASGSGQFLENITRYLGVTIDEVGPLSLKSTNPAKTSGICAVLAETDVINMVSQGLPTQDIIKGIHLSIAGRIIQLLSRFKAESPVVLTGGMAQDPGLVEAMRELAKERNLRLEINPARECMAAGAIGAALWGGFRHHKLLEAAE